MYIYIYIYLYLYYTALKLYQVLGPLLIRRRAHVRCCRLHRRLGPREPGFGPLAWVFGGRHGGAFSACHPVSHVEKSKTEHYLPSRSDPNPTHEPGPKRNQFSPKGKLRKAEPSPTPGGTLAAKRRRPLAAQSFDQSQASHRVNMSNRNTTSRKGFRIMT